MAAASTTFFQRGSRRGRGGRQCGRSTVVLVTLLLQFLLRCNVIEGETATVVAAAAAGASLLLLPRSANSKKVFGLARGGKFQPLGDFCFSIPQGTTGALLAETMLREEGHELLIHSKSAAEEYRNATKEAGVSLDAADDAATTATCNALQTNARVRESLAVGFSVEEQKRTGAPSFFELNLAVDANLDGSDVTAWITRCGDGQQLDAAYSVTFLNPGGFFSRQFSCQDQGLLQLYIVVTLFAAIVCCNALGAYKQQSRLASPLAAATTCCCCLLGGGILISTLHLLAYASDGLGLPLLKFVGQVLLLGSRCGGLVLFLILAAKGVEAGAVDPKTNGVISIVALGVASATLAALLGAALSPDELNPFALYTTLWALPLHTVTGVAAVLVMVMSLLNADAASGPPQRRLFLRLCFWGTGYILGPLFITCFLNSYPLVQAYALLNAELCCICALQRMACRGAQQKSTQMADVKSCLPPSDLPYSEI